MNRLSRLASASAVFLTFGLITGTVTPNAISLTASAQETQPTSPTQTLPPPTSANFPDVASDYWARPFIQGLAARNIITGFPDGNFRPEEPVDRAEFAAMLANAFEGNPTRQLTENQFSDVPGDYWATSAIREAYETGFLSGYPNGEFRPNQEIPKVQAIVALANGLNLTSANPASGDLNTYYTDANAIPEYAVGPVTVATQGNLVVNYPNVQQLNPNRSLTRAEAAALIYQALVRSGQAPPIASNETAASYIVGTGIGGDAPTSPSAGNNNIVAVASGNQSFSTLTQALQATELAQQLQGQGQYTVFAPTNEAFAALPPGTLDRLLLPENRATLTRILRYHVVPQAVTASELRSGEVQTLEGSNLNANVQGNNIEINKASVVTPNIAASNGVIHAVDEVLLPPDLDLSQLEQPRSQNQGQTNATIQPRLNYLGVGGNIGIGGDSAIGEGSFAVYGKVGLTPNISARPAVAIDDDPTILIPITYDFNFRTVDPIEGEAVAPFPVQPFIGGGVGISFNDDTDVGPLITGGVDVPLGDDLMLTGTANVLFLDDTDIGLMLGVGYRF
ncbi:MAG: fasciclin domain-containing protein [Cyanosarcina radialis HA8281-LM2]|jgi:uncharacterized surface protein with fasciclin (FAS1) repeats|nr:fasciclin domain-containing protein [Cyanosarcina radialis HA8281-LM2]